MLEYVILRLREETAWSSCIICTARSYSTILCTVVLLYHRNKMPEVYQTVDETQNVLLKFKTNSTLLAP